jgi:hypothetical protein
MSREKAPWVKWMPNDFLNGIIGLNPIEIAVYTVILNMIYDKGGPIDEDIPRLARRCGARVDHFTRALEELVRMGKVLRADGVLSNKKCEVVLIARSEKLKTLSDNLAVAASQTNEKPNQINDAPAPNAAPERAENEGQTKTQTKRRESVGAKRAAPAQPTPKRASSFPRPSRIPDDWAPGNDGILYARSLNLTQRESEWLAKKFLAHYRGASGPKSVCPDWGSRWQTWCMSEAERLGRTSQDTPAQAAAKQDPSGYSRQEWGRIVQVFQMTSRWNPSNGPAPGERGCLCPSDLIVNHG